MKKFNLYTQITMVGLLILIIVVSCVSLNPGFLLLILYLQLPLGVTQLLCGIGLRIVQREESVRLNKYLILTFINLILIFFFATNHSIKTESYFIAALFGLPWLLAIYYWFISYQLYKTQS